MFKFRLKQKKYIICMIVSVIAFFLIPSYKGKAATYGGQLDSKSSGGIAFYGDYPEDDNNSGDSQTTQNNGQNSNSSGSRPMSTAEEALSNLLYPKTGEQRTLTLLILGLVLILMFFYSKKILKRRKIINESK